MSLFHSSLFHSHVNIIICGCVIVTIHHCVGFCLVCCVWQDFVEDQTASYPSMDYDDTLYGQDSEGSSCKVCFMHVWICLGTFQF